VGEQTVFLLAKAEGDFPRIIRSLAAGNDKIFMILNCSRAASGCPASIRCAPSFKRHSTFSKALVILSSIPAIMVAR